MAIPLGSLVCWVISFDLQRLYVCKIAISLSLKKIILICFWRKSNKTYCKIESIHSWMTTLLWNSLRSILWNHYFSVQSSNDSAQMSRFSTQAIPSKRCILLNQGSLKYSKNTLMKSMKKMRIRLIKTLPKGIVKSLVLVLTNHNYKSQKIVRNTSPC